MQPTPPLSTLPLSTLATYEKRSSYKKLEPIFSYMRPWAHKEPRIYTFSSVPQPEWPVVLAKSAVVIEPSFGEKVYQLLTERGLLATWRAKFIEPNTIQTEEYIQNCILAALRAKFVKPNTLQSEEDIQNRIVDALCQAEE